MCSASQHLPRTIGNDYVSAYSRAIEYTGAVLEDGLRQPCRKYSVLEADNFEVMNVPPRKAGVYGGLTGTLYGVTMSAPS